MKLYHSGTSPYVRKVMMIVHMTGQTDAIELLPGSGTPMEPNAETKSANPLGKVPCLVTEDGRTLFDSRVVCRYLDDRGRGGLYPLGEERWEVETVEALADGVVDAALLVVYEGRLRAEGERSQAWVDAQMAKMRDGVATLGRRMEALKGEPNGAHVAVAAMLGYLDFRFPDLGWRDTAPDLARWFEDAADTEAFRATAPA